MTVKATADLIVYGPDDATVDRIYAAVYAAAAGLDASVHLFETKREAQ